MALMQTQTSHLPPPTTHLPPLTSSQSFSMDLRSHEAFLDVDDSGIFGDPEHEFSFSHAPPDIASHNSQGAAYGYTDASALNATVNPIRDRPGYQDVMKQGEPRSVNKTAPEQRTSRVQPSRDSVRTQPSGPQQLLKDGLRHVRRLQDLENRLTQRISYLEGRVSSLENR